MKTLTKIGIAGLIGFTAFGMASTNAAKAHADEQPELVTTLWLLPVGASWPQPYVAHVNGDDLGAFSASSAGLLCGRNYQADVYTEADYKIVVNDGTLTEGEDYGKALKWNLFSTPACQTATPTPVPTETAPVTPPVTSSPTPVPTSSPTASPTASATPKPSPAPTKSPVSSPAPSAPSPSTAPATAVAAAPTPPSSATDLTASDSSRLAFTGSQHTGAFAALAAGLLAAGGALTRVSILRRRRG